METLLMVAIVVITLAVLAQAGVLIGMYLMSRRISSQAGALMNESRKMMGPLQDISGNLKAVSDDLTETGKIVHEQALRVQVMVTEAQTTIRSTMDEARAVVNRPIRESSAIAAGITEGIRTFFRKKQRKAEIAVIEEERPAA